MRGVLLQTPERGHRVAFATNCLIVSRFNHYFVMTAECCYLGIVASYQSLIGITTVKIVTNCRHWLANVNRVCIILAVEGIDNKKAITKALFDEDQAYLRKEFRLCNQYTHLKSLRRGMTASTIKIYPYRYHGENSLSFNGYRSIRHETLYASNSPACCWIYTNYAIASTKTIAWITKQECSSNALRRVDSFSVFIFSSLLPSSEVPTCLKAGAYYRIAMRYRS